MMSLIKIYKMTRGAGGRGIARFKTQCRGVRIAYREAGLRSALLEIYFVFMPCWWHDLMYKVASGRQSRWLSAWVLDQKVEDAQKKARGIEVVRVPYNKEGFKL